MRQPVYIRTYNVESYMPAWIDEINDTYKHYPESLERFRHTPGAYFRLFADQVLTSSTTSATLTAAETVASEGQSDQEPTSSVEPIGNVLWMDSDVYIMSNLQRFWNQVARRTQYYVQWGHERCSGFMVINVSTLRDFWKRLKTYDLITLTNYTVDEANRVVGQKGLGDQKLVRSMAYTEPDLVGLFPDDAWDVSANNGPWWRSHKIPDGTSLRRHRPRGVGMLHFNGGGSSQESAFEAHPYLMKNLTTYYQDIDEQREAARNLTRMAAAPLLLSSAPASSSTPESGDSGFSEVMTDAERKLALANKRSKIKLDELDRTWKLAHYYDQLDWAWAQYMVESQVVGVDSDAGSGQAGYKIKIFHQ
jgi:hypothetical protein